MSLKALAGRKLTFRTVRSPSRPWVSVLMLKTSAPSPSRMLYAMRALSPRSGSWARSRPTRAPGPAVSTTENWYRPWGVHGKDILREVSSLPPSPSTSFSQGLDWGGVRTEVFWGEGSGVVKRWLRRWHWPLTLRELGGVVVDIAEGDCHRSAARQPPHVAAHVLGLNHHQEFLLCLPVHVGYGCTHNSLGEILGQGVPVPMAAPPLLSSTLTSLGVYREERQSIQHSVHQLGTVPVAGVISIMSSHLDHRCPCGGSQHSTQQGQGQVG